MPNSPVTVEITGSLESHKQQQPQQQQQQQQSQSPTTNGPLFFGPRKRSHSSNCNAPSPDPEQEHDRDHDHESGFEWWFHRRKSSHKSRSRSSSHICGGTTGGSLPFRSSPVSSCCGSQGRSSPETMEQEVYGGNVSNSTVPSAVATTNTTTSTTATVRNGAVPSLYGPISPGQTPGSHSLFLCSVTRLFYISDFFISRSFSSSIATPLCTHGFNLSPTLFFAVSVTTHQFKKHTQISLNSQ
ncbi:uncharacterized protein LOC134217441 [Armigeres subalbatus]|uniref:uncharacterized protein LOC134217441 n=1 Tax=Armigeres subalbatus TaxID=124917 RepID=UPI002ED34560